MTLSIEPLDRTRWDDLVTLFGRGGASSGCWCMWWRLRAKDWSAGAGTAARDPVCGNKAAFEAVVADGEPTGLLAYDDGVPVGWCAVAPRSAYPRLLRSTTIGPLDPDEPGVWSVSCLGQPVRASRIRPRNAPIDRPPCRDATRGLVRREDLREAV